MHAVHYVVPALGRLVSEPAAAAFDFIDSSAILAYLIYLLFCLVSLYFGLCDYQASVCCNGLILQLHTTHAIVERRTGFRTLPYDFSSPPATALRSELGVPLAQRHALVPRAALSWSFRVGRHGAPSFLDARRGTAGSRVGGRRAAGPLRLLKIQKTFAHVKVAAFSNFGFWNLRLQHFVELWNNYCATITLALNSVHKPEASSRRIFL